MCSSEPDTKVKPPVLVLVFTIRELNRLKVGYTHMHFSGNAVLRNSCLCFQLTSPPSLLLSTYQLFIARKLLVRLFSKSDVLNDTFSIHKLAKGQVAKREVKYCIEKKILIKMHHTVMVYHSASWAKCQSD